MDKKSTYESKLQKAALSCDAFTTGYFVMGLLFAVTYVSTFGGKIVMWFLPIACLLPLALAPLFYVLVHRVDILLFGRYHLIMPVSAFMSALFFVIIFCADELSAASACLIFFGFSVFAVFITVYKYCAFSVRARLVGDGVTSSPRIYTLFSVLGCAAALIAFIAFWFCDSENAFLDTAYVLGALNIVAALIQYLTSYYGIPRLSGRRAVTVKNVFRSFYSGLNKRVYFSSLLFMSACAVIAALILYFGAVKVDNVYIVACIPILLCVGYAAADIICKRFVKQRSFALSIFNFVCLLLASTILTVVAAVGVLHEALYALILCAAALCGMGGGAVARQTVMRFAAVKPRVTSGVVYMLIELTAFAALAIAFTVAACVVTAGESYAFIYGFAAAFALAVAAFVLASKKVAVVTKTPDLSYELTTAEMLSTVIPSASDRDEDVAADE